jgi:phosphate transport system substrate-binding protein
MSRLALAAGAAALSLTLLTPPAGAADSRALSLGFAGSDTTYFMMVPISKGFVASTKYNVHKDKVTQIPPTNKDPFPATVTVPKDWEHGAKTWNSSNAQSTPPNGSGAGITALLGDSNGFIDAARSSRGPNPGETNTMNFWAYALGAVDYVTFPGTHAPAAGLTVQQLVNIYTCDPATHAPFVTDWSQVGGTAGPIIKYAPQLGSGTLSFFGTKLLNGGTVDQNCDSAHQSIRVEEHDARNVATADKPGAIFMYDWGKYNAQKSGFEKNLTNGAVLGKTGISAPLVTPSKTNVNETSNRFVGVRYLFNVVRKANHPGQRSNQFSDVTRFIGVKTTKLGGPGYICSGAAGATITKAGFVPLPKKTTGGTGLPASNCRLNPTPL